MGWEAALTVQRVNLKWEWVKQGGNEKTNEIQKVKAASTYSSYNVPSFQVNRAASADQQVKSKISISVEKNRTAFFRHQWLVEDFRILLKSRIEHNWFQNPMHKSKNILSFST